MLSENNLYRKAVHIAAVVMVAAGLCRYESVDKCRKVWPPEESSCVLCVENWLIMRARKEMRHG
ncbi:MAG: hypothetical protein IK149_01640 [Oscillospiraceae bacterium]|nr:hypothetical protein [Oscillospiraceae bacterium]